ncbi:MAG: HAD family hydrolase [Proteobacteria bacterium]|nr:MAG: HAD family hydrolase [Pseudomonadota bacterium]
MTIDAILFDLGGVLIDWNPRYLYKPLFKGDDEAMEQFLADVCPPHWNVQMDAGKPFHEAIAERSLEFPDHAELIAMWKSGWTQMLRDAVPESVEILDSLRQKGLRLYALTNWSAETFPFALERFDFLQWFEHIVVSGDIKLAKPDPRIFQHAIERCRLTPRSTVFIDDSLKNVEAARRLGLHGIHFEDPAGLKQELQAMGVLA